MSKHNNFLYEVESESYEIDEDGDDVNVDVDDEENHHGVAVYDEEGSVEDGGKVLSMDYSIDCCPIVPHTFSGENLSQRGSCCQICLFEGKGVVTKNVVTCYGHKVRVCADVSVNESPMINLYLKRMGKDSVNWVPLMFEGTCWEKLHQWYVPQGLFPSIEQLKQHAPKKFCAAFKKHPFYIDRMKCASYYTHVTGHKVDGISTTWKEEAPSKKATKPQLRTSRCATARENKLAVVKKKQSAELLKKQTVPMATEVEEVVQSKIADAEALVSEQIADVRASIRREIRKNNEFLIGTLRELIAENRSAEPNVGYGYIQNDAVVYTCATNVLPVVGKELSPIPEVYDKEVDLTVREVDLTVRHDGDTNLNVDGNVEALRQTRSMTRKDEDGCESAVKGNAHVEPKSVISRKRGNNDNDDCSVSSKNTRRNRGASSNDDDSVTSRTSKQRAKLHS